MMPLYMSVKVRQTTTPGTTCPTLYEECVGSLTSHRFITCARACETGLRFIVLIRDYVRDYESTYILRDRLQHFCHWGTQMRIFLRFYSRADLKGDNGLPALILSQILLTCQQNLSSVQAVQHLIFGLLDQAPGWVPGWAHEEYADAIYSVSRTPPTYSISTDG